jgi:hypothetical protein
MNIKDQIEVITELVTITQELNGKYQSGHNITIQKSQNLISHLETLPHECKFYVNSNWTKLTCNCGKEQLPSEN